MKAPTNLTVFLKDYQPSPFLIETADLDFDLHEDCARVTSRLRVTRNPLAPYQPDLRLDGEELSLQTVSLDGQPLKPDAYQVGDRHLTIVNPPDQFDVEIVTQILPQKNSELQGLYRSGQLFCTQNEPEGFRRITFFLDRPDIMAKYTTRIEADAKLYPVLLSNGNCVGRGSLPGGRHWVKWEDPFKKPSYLFALVAGDLGKMQDHFVTRSGRRVELEIYVNKGNEPRCQHAMESLKRAMGWDEERFGLEYDLDIFMIVAVEDFNGGAMENKGLNIFNSKYVLADPKVATDTDYEQIEGVIAHEYFHNWTGNRITCRDWFQLSLKEGLTVFRDQEFSADMGARAVRRIAEVARLRNLQFAEDAGPMAHPVRPSSYMEINNFYTMTVYEKGAEVIRMIQTLVGRDGFRRGMDKYFELYDGQAVTTEDFVHAMAVANGVDLTQFKLWYDQAGTPELHVRCEYDANQKRVSLHLRQSCRATAETAVKKPFHIPVKMGLLDADGRELIGNRLLELKSAEQTFYFDQVQSKPVASVLREFSAPVNVRLEARDEELLFLMAHDSDLFNRWDASQQVVHRQMRELMNQYQAGQALQVRPGLVAALRKLVSDDKLEPAFRAQVLSLPPEGVYAQLVQPVNPEAIHGARQVLLKSLAEALEGELTTLHSRQPSLASGPYSVEVAGQRALRNQALYLLIAGGKASAIERAVAQLHSADNMTDEIAALVALASVESKPSVEAIEHFYAKWKHESLVINKWLQVQAGASLSSTLTRVQELIHHPAFDSRNPNKVQSLLVAFGRDNLYGFHSTKGESYRFMADQILQLDALNPQVSSRVVAAFNYWRQFAGERRELMREQLERLHKAPQLSKNVFEIVSKALVEDKT